MAAGVALDPIAYSRGPYGNRVAREKWSSASEARLEITIAAIATIAIIGARGRRRKPGIRMRIKITIPNRKLSNARPVT